MDRLESGTHSFVIRIWIEETRGEAGRILWRGHITHVPTRKQHYILDVADIIAFILPYLQEMGIKTGLGWRIRLCLRQWKLWLARGNR